MYIACFRTRTAQITLDRGARRTGRTGLNRTWHFGMGGNGDADLAMFVSWRSDEGTKKTSGWGGMLHLVRLCFL